MLVRGEGEKWEWVVLVREEAQKGEREGVSGQRRTENRMGSCHWSKTDRKVKRVGVSGETGT